MRHIRKLSGIAVLAGASAAAIAASAFAAEYTMTVNRDRLINAQNEPQNWLMMNGDYGSTRYSKLTQINRENVKNLRMVWALALGGMQDVGQNGPENEVNPLIDNGFMYTTDGWGTVYKIDARNPNKGEFVWISDPGVQHEGNVPRTRGIALWEDLVIANLPDGRVIAINRDNGEIVWDKKVAGKNEFGSQEKFFTAPIAAEGKVLVAERRGRRRHARLDRRARRQDRQRAVALVRGAEAGRSRQRDLEGQDTTPGRPAAAASGRPAPTIPATKLYIWGTGNPVPIYDPQFASGRQPLHQLGGRARHRYRQARLVLPVHAERFLGLRRGRRPHALRHHDQRRERARSSAISGATASSTRSIAPTASSSRADSTSTI